MLGVLKRLLRNSRGYLGGQKLGSHGHSGPNDGGGNLTPLTVTVAGLLIAATAAITNRFTANDITINNGVVSSTMTATTSFAVGTSTPDPTGSVFVSSGLAVIQSTSNAVSANRIFQVLSKSRLMRFEVQEGGAINAGGAASSFGTQQATTTVTLISIGAFSSNGFMLGKSSASISGTLTARSSITIQSDQFSVGGSTFSIANGSITLGGLPKTAALCLNASGILSTCTGGTFTSCTCP